MADSRKSTAWVDWVVKEVREHQLRSVGARSASGSAAAAAARSRERSGG
jgi:hypothetical protein